MNLEKMFEMQAELDNRIIREKGLEGASLMKKREELRELLENLSCEKNLLAQQRIIREILKMFDEEETR